MDFTHYLEHTIEELTVRDLVGLGFYYLEVEEEEAPIPVHRVQELIKYSPRPASPASVSAYPSQIAREDGYIKPIDDEGYILTDRGKRYYGDLIDLPNSPASPREDSFLNVNNQDDDFYGPLIDDIEKSYQYRLYDATLVMSRKLFENLLIDILRGHFGVKTKEDRALYYNDDRAMFKPFSSIVESFEENLDQFKPYMPELDQDFVDNLNQFRHRSNASAHSVTVDVDEETIEALSAAAEEIAQMLFRLRTQVLMASDTWNQED